MTAAAKTNQRTRRSQDKTKEPSSSSTTTTTTTTTTNIHTYIHTYANSQDNNPKILRSYKIRKKLAHSFSLFCKFLHIDASSGVSEAMMNFMEANMDKVPINASFNLVSIEQPQLQFVGVEVNLMRQTLEPILDGLKKPDLNNNFKGDLIRKLKAVLPKAVRVARKTDNSEFNLLLVEAQILLSDEHETNPVIVEIKRLQSEIVEFQREHDKTMFALENMVPKDVVCSIYDLNIGESDRRSSERHFLHRIEVYLNQQSRKEQRETIEQQYYELKEACFNRRIFEPSGSANKNLFMEYWLPKIQGHRGKLSELQTTIRGHEQAILRLKHELAGGS